MPVPAVIAGAIAVQALISLLGTGYSARETIRTANFNREYALRGYAENARYWDDYFKNTGYRPRYPIRSGADYNLGSYYGAEQSRAGAFASVLNSVGHVGTSGAYGLDSYYGGKRK